MINTLHSLAINTVKTHPHQHLSALTNLSVIRPGKSVALACLFLLSLVFSFSIQAQEGYGCEFVPDYPPTVHFPGGYSDCETYYSAGSNAGGILRYSAMYKKEEAIKAVILAKAHQVLALDNCTITDFFDRDGGNTGTIFAGGKAYYQVRQADIYCNGQLQKTFLSYSAHTTVCNYGSKVSYTQAWNYSGDATNHPYICNGNQFSLVAETVENVPVKFCVFNPCDPITGNKTQRQVDIPAGRHGLGFSRYYQSLGLGDGYKELGRHWRHSYTAHLDGYSQLPDHGAFKGIKSGLYNTPASACIDGWEEIKAVAYGGQLAHAGALYQDNTCQIQANGIKAAVLRVHSESHVAPPTADTTVRTVSRPDGTIYTFTRQDGVWYSTTNTPVKLEAISGGWQFTGLDDTIEVFDDQGRLLSSTDRNRLITTFSYDANDRLAQVTGPFGRTLEMAYNQSGYLQSVTSPDGTVSYEYDAGNNNLLAVSYPDATPATAADNPTRRYVYEDTAFPYHLTGIIDENGDRYATWAYDAEGRVISSEHAGGADRGTLTYNADGTTSTSDALGAQQTYHFEPVQGVLKVTQIDGDRCATCGNDAQSYAYDSNGFINRKVDWNGNITTLVNNAQGLPTSRTEAVGTPQQRTLSTQWHAVFRLPVLITEPGRETALSYTATGQLISRTVTDTASGAARTWTYQYDDTAPNTASSHYLSFYINPLHTLLWVWSLMDTLWVVTVQTLILLT